MENGTRFPPITVFFDIENEIYVLGDGFHRLFAHLRAKPNDPIIVEQYLGNVQDAQWYSIGANKSHGLKRSNEDKRNAVMLALLHPNGAKLCDSLIAQHVGVTHPTVIKVRKTLEAEGRLEKFTSRVGKDGRTYNVTNIGKAPNICGGCGHYKSPRCLMDDEMYAPNDPACEDFVPIPQEEPEQEEEIEESGDSDDREYVPKDVRRRVGRRKAGEYVDVPLSKTDTDKAAAEIRHYFNDNYLAALAQSALKLLKD